MARNISGFGSIDRLLSGRWRVRYYDSSRKRHTSPISFPTKADANAYLATIHADIIHGTYIDPRSGRLTLGKLAEDWLKRPGKRAATIDRDKQAVDAFLSILGDRPIASLTPLMIQNAVNKRSDEASPATVSRDFAVLRAILNLAVDLDLLQRSPARKVALPRIVRPTRITLAPEDLKRLVDEIPSQYKALVLVAGVAGLSWSEAVGLRIKDIDLKNNTLRVAQTVEELKGIITIVPEGKRPARLREIAIPRFLTEAISTHIKTFRQNHSEDSEALLFVGPKGGTLRRRFGERVFRPAVIRAGLKGLTFHGLRHAATSSLVDIGIHPRVMATRIGHGSIKTTMEIYAKSSSSADRDAAELLQIKFEKTFSDDE